MDPLKVNLFLRHDSSLQLVLNLYCQGLTKQTLRPNRSSGASPLAHRAVPYPSHRRCPSPAGLKMNPGYMAPRLRKSSQCSLYARAIYMAQILQLFVYRVALTLFGQGPSPTILTTYALIPHRFAQRFPSATLLKKNLRRHAEFTNYTWI
jgi:hypothetical protein